MSRKKIQVGPVGPDVDLDTEEMLTADGRRLTGEVVGEIVEEARTRRRGRPSVTGGKVHTPVLTLRVPPPLRAELEAIAQAQGRRLADVSREALEEYAARHSS